MKKQFAAGVFLALGIAALPGSAAATTWLGTVSDSHCTPEKKGLVGDDPRCIVFIANDKQVYTIENQDAVQKHIGHEVSLTGTLNEEMIIGISYQTQGIVHADSVTMAMPVTATAEEQSAFQASMKSLQPMVTLVRTAITERKNEDVAKEAEKLTAVFDTVAAFWEKQHNADALKFAKAAVESSAAVAASTAQIDQVLALRKVSEACSGCHLSHRSGKQGSFKIIQ